MSFKGHLDICKTNLIKSLTTSTLNLSSNEKYKYKHILKIIYDSGSRKQEAGKMGRTNFISNSNFNSLKFNNSKKGIGPVVATALLLVVAVAAVLGFQTWFQTYQSNLNTDIEMKSNSNLGNTQIETLVGNTLYFKNGGSNNITITSVKIDGIDCNVSGNYSSGMQPLDISQCINNITTSTPDIVVFTTNGIFQEKTYIKGVSTPSTPAVLASCSLNGTTITSGSSATYYEYDKPYNNLAGCSAISQVRTCTDGVLNGSALYDTALCNDSLAPSVGGEWVLSFGNSALLTTDFYVMKYEAKNVGGVATSQPALTPWTSITQTNSITECSNLGAGYQLISNAQWTTAAREAELITANWDSGVVGSGSMWRGHSDNSPAAALSVSNVNDYYNQTGNVAPSIERRALELNSGEVIWDMGGNVYNWNIDTCTQNSPWYNSVAWIEWTNANLAGVSQEKDLAGPLGAYTSTNGVGQYYGCTTTGNAFLRGGGWNNGANAGAFMLNLYYAPSAALTTVGFRCSYAQ